MNEANIKNLQIDRFSANVEIQADGLKLTMSGELSAQDPTAIITPYLMELHKMIQKSQYQKIVVDFSPLRFVNSSGLKAFMVWIKQIRNESAGQRYKVEAVYTPEKPWQKRALSLLKSIGGDILEIRSV